MSEILKKEEKMNKKIVAKSIIYAMVVLLALPLILLGGGKIFKSAKAAENNVTAEYYFYNQLTNDTQREFYQEMEEMAEIDENGESVFIRGGDMIVDGVLTQEQLADYATGRSNQLLDDFGAAKDAFYFDHADLFYVDFSYLSFTITLRNGEYMCYLGTGRAETYYTQGINSKADVLACINEYNVKLDKLVEDTKKSSHTLAEKVRYAHDAISNNAVYKLEDTAKKKNIGFIRTSYGALVSGECCCEGYARAFKSVMDRIGVPCVLVQGIYRHSSTAVELHMWNYVYVDGAWLGVDVTFDDLDKNINGSEVSYNYFLRGASIMARQHAPSAVVSKSNFEFAYPELSELNFGESFSKSNELFRITQSKGEPLTYTEIENGQISKIVPVLDKDGNQVYTTDIKVSFYLNDKWCNWTTLKENGYYLLMRIYYKSTGDSLEVEDLNSTSWSYANPEIYSFPETEDALTLEGNATAAFFEFAVTDVPPRDPATIDYKKPNYLDQIAETTTYCGDPTKLFAESGLIKADYGDPYYVAQPYIKKATPDQTGSLTVGKTYHVEVYYDDNLKLKDPNLPYDVTLIGETPFNEVIHSLTENVKIENVKWDPEEDASKVEFDFTPSEMFAHDSVLYLFSMKNLVGEKSNKAPNDVIYYVTHGCVAHAYAAQGYDWNLFAKPTLLENADLSMNGWETSDGEEVSDLLRHRLALVVTNTTYEQEEEMDEFVSELNGGKEIKSSQTYNINLTVCKAQVVRTGDSVRISLGFPEGYGPNDAGVTFKAYHFTRDEQNHVTGVEELNCVITEYGLIITCNAFSPFAIVAVEADASEPVQEVKQVILSNNYGGTVVGNKQETIVSLDKDSLTDAADEEVITIKATEGYIIESITLAGNAVEFSDNKEASVTLRYDELENNQAILDVKFITEVAAVKNEEIAHSTLKAANISLTSTEIEIKEGEKLEIVANVEEFGDVNTYAWYKDGVALQGQHGKTYTINAASPEDSGRYKFVVISSSNNQNISSSKEVNVKINAKEEANVDMILILSISIPAVAVLAFALVLLILISKRKKKYTKE